MSYRERKSIYREDTKSINHEDKKYTKKTISAWFKNKKLFDLLSALCAFVVHTRKGCRELIFLVYFATLRFKMGFSLRAPRLRLFAVESLLHITVCPISVDEEIPHHDQTNCYSQGAIMTDELMAVDGKRRF